MNKFFQDEAESTARHDAMDQINNRNSKGTIVKAHTMHRVEGQTHFFGKELDN